MSFLTTLRRMWRRKRAKATNRRSFQLGHWCRLEQRRLLAADMAFTVPGMRFVPVGPNGADAVVVEGGARINVDVWFTADPPVEMVGWHLQFNASAPELHIHQFSYSPDWLGSFTLDSFMGSTLVTGANFNGIQLSSEPYSPGSFVVDVPDAEGIYHVTVEPPPNDSNPDRTLIASLDSTLPIGQYAEFYVVVDDQFVPPPVANDDQIVTTQDTPISFDPTLNDGFAIASASLVGQPSHGDVVIHPDLSMTYTPNPQFIGSDTFEYQVSNAGGQTATASITVHVVPQAPRERSFIKSGKNVVFYGSLRSDSVFVRGGNEAGEIFVVTKNKSFGPLTMDDGGLLVLHLFGGNDDIRIAGYLDSIPTFIDAGAGNDRIFGSGGRDTLMGGSGNDRLFGGDGANYLDGGPGNDEIHAGAVGSILVGGEGNDQLLGARGDDFIFGQGGNDWMLGMAGNDVLVGGNDDDLLLGGHGIDLLLGGDGNDLIKGGNDDDVLFGGRGFDVLNGGQGSDALTGNQSMFAYHFKQRYELAQLLANWIGGSTVDNRIALLAFDANDDLATDILIGGAERDWFFATTSENRADFVPAIDHES